MYMHFSYRKCKLQEIETTNTLSMSYIMRLTTMDYLTDEVNTVCILCGQSEVNKTFKHIHGHHNGKGINKLPRIRILSLHKISVQLRS